MSDDEHESSTTGRSRRSGGKVWGGADTPPFCGQVKDSLSLPTVLLVEDDDMALAGLVFRRAKLPCQLQTVRTIEMAREYLCGWGMYGNREEFPMPCLIITDLGFASHGDSAVEFLRWLRGSRYRSIPVACLTGSDDPAHVDEARNLVSACIQKFLTFEDLVAFIRQILGSGDQIPRGL